MVRHNHNNVPESLLIPAALDRPVDSSVPLCHVLALLRRSSGAPYKFLFVVLLLFLLYKRGKLPSSPAPAPRHRRALPSANFSCSSCTCNLLLTRHFALPLSSTKVLESLQSLKPCKDWEPDQGSADPS